MVTVEKYISTFVRIIPQRAEKLRLLAARKEIIDAKILKSRTLNQNTATELLTIIGDEKTPNSIRRALLKIQKSLVFFLDKRKNVIDKIYEETQNIKRRNAGNQDAGTIFYSDMINLRGSVETIVYQLLPLINKLNDIYSSEVALLRQEDKNQNAYVDSYIEILKREQENAKSIKNTSKTIIQFQRNLQGFITRLLSTENQDILVGSAIGVIGLTLFASILAIPSIMYGADTIKDATPMIPKVIAMVGGLIGSITSLSTFAKFLGESV